MTGLGRNRPPLAGAVAVATVAALLTAACTDAPATPTSWASRAEQYFDNSAEAERQGLANLNGFYAADVRFDYGAIAGVHGSAAGFQGSGRAAALTFLSTIWNPPDVRRLPAGKVYVSATGAVRQIRWTETDPLAKLAVPVDAVLVESTDGRGITSETFAIAEASGRRFSPGYPGWRTWHRTALEYLTTWSAGDAAHVTDLYSTGAVVADSLGRVSLGGPAAIIDSVSGSQVAGGLRGARLDAIADFGGPALFESADLGTTTGVAPMSTTVLLLTVDRTAGCTDRLAVVLNLDVAGRISAEQRFHRTDTPLACFPDGTPPTGWWNAVTMPATVNTVHTGDLKLGTGMVAIWNGTPALDRLTRWAFDRFAAAGLSLPPVKRITILAADADACDGILGYAVGPAVTLCLDVKVACIDSGCSKWQPWAKATLLHELAHLWLGSNAKPATKSAFLKRTGLATWDGGSVPAGARGGEAAAQTIAWGLTDEPYSTISGSKVPACAEIGVRFLMLTGMAPISPRC